MATMTISRTTRKQKRAALILAGLAILGIALALVLYAVNDTIKTVPVSYKGQLPDLFREGQGVVTEGKLDASGNFIADTVLAKHDETYMPKDVADRLKAMGVWKEGKGAGP